MPFSQYKTQQGTFIEKGACPSVSPQHFNIFPMVWAQTCLLSYYLNSSHKTNAIVLYQIPSPISSLLLLKTVIKKDFSIFDDQVDELYNINHFQQQHIIWGMSQYEYNMDFTDLFSCFSHPHHDSSSLLQIRSNEDLGQNQIYEEQPLQEISKEIPTTDNNLQITSSQCSSTSIQSTRQVQFASEVRQRNWAVQQGQKDDTMELNINFKTIICNHFRELLMANELTPAQQRQLAAFSRRSPSFKSLLLFCKGEEGEGGMSGLCRGLVDDSLIVRRILGSKCRMGTKLNMIKFVQALRRNTRGEAVTKWKSLSKP